MANTLTIRNEAGEVIGTPHVGSRAVLWQDRTGTLRSLIGTPIQGWIAHQQELIATPDWHQGEPRLAATQQQLLDTVVTVRDECAY